MIYLRKQYYTFDYQQYININISNIKNKIISEKLVKIIK